LSTGFCEKIIRRRVQSFDWLQKKIRASPLIEYIKGQTDNCSGSSVKKNVASISGQVHPGQQEVL